MKPEHCLFCLGSNLRVLRVGLNFCVGCLTCKARGPEAFTKDKAITDWNRPPLGMGHQRDITGNTPSADVQPTGE